MHYALRAQLPSALCCLTLAGLYCYWIHGSALVGIDVRRMPLLASYPSQIDTSPAVESVYIASSVLCTATHSTLRAAIRLDAAIDDVFHASLRYSPLFFYTLFTSAPASPRSLL
eukprot:3796-Pleurochrysis_carterae.AAC.1